MKKTLQQIIVSPNTSKLMKRLFFLTVYAMVCALFFSACDAPIKDVGHVVKFSAIYVVSQEQEDGTTLYGAKYQDRISIPPVFDRFEAAMEIGLVYAYKGTKCALFHIDGTEVLSGRICGEKEIGFEPLWIDKSQEPRQSLESANIYCGQIFCCGEYYKFALENGKFGILFLPMSQSLPLGPYDDFLPGFFGYMFKDNGGWGATFLRIREKTYDRLDMTIEPTSLANGERFDEIIEVVKKKTNSVWFARKGNSWRSFDVALEYGKLKHIKEIPVDSKLLAKVLKMPVRKQARILTDFDLASNQRVGIKDGDGGVSVVFFI